MASHYQYAFESLPSETRKQLARSAGSESAAYQEASSNLRFYFFKIALALFCALFLFTFVFKNFGNPIEDDGWTGGGDMLFYALTLFGLAHTAVAVRTRIRLAKKFRFLPGRYLFPFTLVDARSDTLQVFDLLQMIKLDTTHHHVNGAYNKTIFTFSFPDASAQSLTIANKKRAEEALRRFTLLQKSARAAFDNRDLKALRELDPLLELRKNKWQLPDNARRPSRNKFELLFKYQKTAAVVLAILITPLLWLARNAAGDARMYQEAKSWNTEKAYLGYIEHGKFHVAEMQAALPRVVFNAVKNQGSVSALRQVLARFPKAGLQEDVAKEIHALYQRSLARFREQAVSSDAVLVAAMEKLLASAEQRSDPRVLIRFTRPTLDALTQLDARLKLKETKVHGKTIMPAAGHFSDNSAASREGRIIAGLQTAFRTIFPNDVLSFVGGGNADSKPPMLDIAYQIDPSGATYTSEKNPHSFVGLVIRFQAALIVPDVEERWRFNLEVEPPESFHVEYKTAHDSVNDGPPDSQVYAVMAERAFDTLAAKISAAFFRPDSAAFLKQNGQPKPAKAPNAPAGK